MATPCFWIEPAGRWRRYASVTPPCGHDHREVYQSGTGEMPDSDWDAAPWPRDCPTCGQEIDYEHAETHQSLGGETFYRRADTGEEGTISDFGPGAMWNAHWMSDHRHGPDGRCLVVRLPNGLDFNMDTTAHNCDRKGEEHDCWCRHGEPPNITVDKVPEPGRSTCTAGAGSIWSAQDTDRSWHGFLRGGVLLECGVDGV